jgi:hypothetical protein
LEDHHGALLSLTAMMVAAFELVILDAEAKKYQEE